MFRAKKRFASASVVEALQLRIWQSPAFNIASRGQEGSSSALDLASISCQLRVPRMPVPAVTVFRDGRD